MWTDKALPTTIGVPAIVTIYGSVSDNGRDKYCKYRTIQVDVMRCPDHFSYTDILVF